MNQILADLRLDTRVDASTNDSLQNITRYREVKNTEIACVSGGSMALWYYTSDGSDKPYDFAAGWPVITWYRAFKRTEIEELMRKKTQQMELRGGAQGQD